jgi:hypothetical protein
MSSGGPQVPADAVDGHAVGPAQARSFAHDARRRTFSSATLIIS